MDAANNIGGDSHIILVINGVYDVFNIMMVNLRLTPTSEQKAYYQQKAYDYCRVFIKSISESSGVAFMKAFVRDSLIHDFIGI